MKAWKASVQIAIVKRKKTVEAWSKLKDARRVGKYRKEMKDMQKELSKSPVADDSSDDSDLFRFWRWKKKRFCKFPAFFLYFFSNDIDEEVGSCHFRPWITIKSGGTVWKRSQLHRRPSSVWLVIVQCLKMVGSTGSFCSYKITALSLSSRSWVLNISIKSLSLWLGL